MTPSLVARILAILLAAMPATRGFADQTNLVREVQVGETGIPTTRALSHLAAGPTTADTVAVDSPLAHAADTEAQPPRPVAVPGGTDHSLSAGTFGSIVARTSATMRLPPLDELRVPSAAGRQRVSVAQAGPPVPDQKRPSTARPWWRISSSI